MPRSLMFRLKFVFRLKFGLFLTVMTVSCGRVQVEELDGTLPKSLGDKAKLEKIINNPANINTGLFLANSQSYLYTDHDNLYKWKNETGGELIFANREISDMIKGEEFNHLYIASCARKSIIAMNLRGGGETELANQSEGQEFSCPSFLALHQQGSIFFVDTNIDHKNAILYRVDADGFSYPLMNIPFVPGGLMLSQDQKSLYMSDPANLKVLIVTLDTSLQASKLETFFELQAQSDRLEISTLSDIAQGKSETLYVGTDKGIIIISQAGVLIGRLLKNKDIKSISVSPENGAIYVAGGKGAMRVLIK